MKKFLVLYYAPVTAVQQMGALSPEEQGKAFEPWMAWAARCGDSLVEMGTPLGNVQRLTKSGGLQALRK